MSRFRVYYSFFPYSRVDGSAKVTANNKEIAEQIFHQVASQAHRQPIKIIKTRKIKEKKCQK